MELINKMKSYMGKIKLEGLQSAISENKAPIIVESGDNIAKVIKENPYSIDLLVISFMIRTMTQYKEEEKESIMRH